MSRFKLKSHPDRLLVDHIIGSYKIANDGFDLLKLTFSSFSREALRETLRTAVLFHDFGKATNWFQEYIAEPQNNKASTRTKRLRRHSLISSVLALGILEEKFPNDSVYPALGFYIVKHHHGDLRNWTEVFVLSEDDIELCKEQIKGIDYNEYREIVSDAGYSEWVDPDVLQQILGEIENGKYHRLREFRRLNRDFQPEHYFVINLLYSLLLTADKQDAIFQRDIHVKAPACLNSRQVETFKNKLPFNKSNPIFKIRNVIFDSVKLSINDLNADERIVSINTPTGSGKTITSLFSALKLAEKFGRDHVIYCLPFTSIIDQNYKVFNDIHEESGLPEDSRLLLKHHYLADIRYTVEDEHSIREYLPNEALYLIEGWESNITVTTFVQFLYLLISIKNSRLRKFHRLSNAVIILDEVQTIPHRYWKLIHDMLKRLVHRLNSHLILVTATMPLIFSEEHNEISELIKGKEGIFSSLSRIDLNVSRLNIKNGNTQKVSWECFSNDMITLVERNKKNDILIILNTIRSTKDTFDLLKKKTSSHQFLFLSSHVIPASRLELIGRIKEKRQDAKPLLLVSTQLVEAGVDIDFDIVIRDLAPLDSIFQACGRCNRNSRKGVNGEIIIYSILDSKGFEPASIYDKFLLNKTVKVLEGSKIIHESEFMNLAQKYFKEVSDFGSERASVMIMEKIGNLTLDKEFLKEEFTLIDDNFNASVFVEKDDNAKKVWQKYKDVFEWESSFEKNVELKKIRKGLANYIINVPKRCLPNGHDGALYRLKRQWLKDHYDKTSGFNTDKQLPPEQSSVIF